MKEALIYMLRFVRPYFRRLWLGGVCLAGMTIITLVEPYLYKLIVDTLIELGSAVEASADRLWQYLLLWSGVSIVSLICYSLYRYIAEMTFLDLHRNFYMYAYEKVIALDMRRHLEKKSGEMMKKVDNAGETMFWVPFEVAVTLLPAWMSGVAVLIMAWIIHWQMTLVTISLVPVYLLLFFFGELKTHQKQSESIDRYNEAIGRGYDALANIQVVKSFAAERKEYTLFQEVLDRATVFQKSISRFWVTIGSAEFFLRIITRLVIFAGGIYFVGQNSISIGTLIMFLAFSGYLYAPFQALGNLQSLQKRLLTLQKAKQDIELIPEVNDFPHAAFLQVPAGKIELHNLSFSYHPQKSVLQDVTAVFPAGKVTALVGHSGAGKSTVVSLLNRFYELQAGIIAIDGQDISKVTQESLRKNIGMVMQDNTMFNDTILKNIQYGNPSSSTEEVIRAAQQANIHDFILSLPDQYETIVGERGLKLSGGEKQRVAIARAILKNPPILVLDEATSALDSETERSIQQSLETLMKNRTTIVIAHRLSTVRKADQIIVLEQGRIIESGTHAELIDQAGIYKHLVDLQVGGFLGE